MEQCIVRYGKQVDTNEAGRSFFLKGGLEITVSFYDGKADSISFRKLGTRADGRPFDLSDNEINTLLTANGSKPWKPSPSTSASRLWTTDDGTLLASYYPPDPTLSIMTRNAVEREKASRQATEKSKLEGF